MLGLQVCSVSTARATSDRMNGYSRSRNLASVARRMKGTVMSFRNSAGFGFVALAALLAFPDAAATAADTPPTFTRDIAPIFQSKCEACHRPDGMAPMSLVSYEDARPWAKSIAARVGGRQMPPWHIDKTVGIQKFKNDRSLNDAEIDTILQWISAGAPK